MISTTILALWLGTVIAAFVLGAIAGVLGFWAGFRLEFEDQLGRKPPALWEVIRRG